MDFSTLILGIGITLGFFVQTILGFGASLTALPFLLIILDLRDSIALIAVFLPFFSTILIYQNRKLINKKVVLEMAIGGVIGLTIGIFALKYGNPEILKKLLGVFIVCYVGYSTIKRQKVKIFNKLGFVFALLGGFFSGLYSSGGSLFATYIYNKLEQPKLVRATIIGSLGIINFIRIPLLVGTGIITMNTVEKSLYMIPFFLIALFLGNKFYSKINQVMFKKFFLIVLFILGLKLIFF
ncbi:MAG: sulfite exporter TauE/SafE family protein [bacterium]|nr:sulfite exporter TauE/SafE family protein [bacterium]